MSADVSKRYLRSESLSLKKEIVRRMALTPVERAHDGSLLLLLRLTERLTKRQARVR